MNITSPSSSLDVVPQKQQQQQDDDNDDDDRCWQNQHDWIERKRQYKQQLQNQGIKGWELMECMTQFNLDHKQKTFSSGTDDNNNRKCRNCWHPQKQSKSCICERLMPLKERIASQVQQNNKNIIFQAEEEGPCRQYHHHHHHHPFQAVKILLLMHPKEYYCAGNSGNLVLQVLPSGHHPNTLLSSSSLHSDSNIVSAQHFIFGKPGDVDRLWKQISLQKKLDSTTIILWPGPDAISLSTYLQQQQRLLQEETSEKQQQQGVSTITTTSNHHTITTTLNVIVLDGTYTQARNMFHSIRKRWSSNIDQSSLMLPQTIKLEPTSKSIFHRAQKRYGSSHQQSQQQQQQQKNENVAATTNNVVRRISTAEACGLLLTQVLGMDFSIIEDCLIEAVQINNNVLAYARNREKESNNK